MDSKKEERSGFRSGARPFPVTEPILLTLGVGFISGYLSGQLGVGGGLITTPAIRLALHRPAEIAIGTPLAVIIPSALVGAVNYARKGFIDWLLVRRFVEAGIPGVIAGAFLTPVVGGKAVMLATAGVIALVALRYIWREAPGAPSVRRRHGRLAHWVAGFASGFYAGFLGLGGGVLMVPALTYFGKDVKTAFGTSLVGVAAFAVPGTVLHYYLGNVDLNLAFLLAAGVIPGAYVGSAAAVRMSGRTLQLAFGLFLLVTAAYFALFEIAEL